MNTVEGTLDIFWENSTQLTDARRYRLHFAKFKDFRGGSLPYKQVTGASELESYLIGLGFSPENTKNSIEKAHKNGSVFIHVILEENNLAPYIAPSA